MKLWIVGYNANGGFVLIGVFTTKEQAVTASVASQYKAWTYEVEADTIANELLD